METTEQLFILKQIWAQDSYHDPDTGQDIQRIPDSIGREALDALEKAGRAVNNFERFTHDEAVNELRTLAAEWRLEDAANAYVASLWSAPWIWRAALTGKALGDAMPEHALHPYSAHNPVCRICGFEPGQALDKTLVWYQAMTEGNPIDGHVPEHVLLLRELKAMRQASALPLPTEYDRWALAKSFDIIKNLPPKTRYSKAAKALKEAALLPSNAIHAHVSLLESLTIIGVLATPEYPGMLTAFTSYIKRDERPNIRVEVQAPLAWWNSSYGVCEDVADKVFGHLHLERIALSCRPAAHPPLTETRTGALARRRPPKETAPKASAAAGKGPAAAGDVYAIRIREGVWVTAYCHEIGLRGKHLHARMEYLDGIYTEMPSANKLNLRYRGRKNGRCQQWATSIDSTPWVRRVARGVPAPRTDEPEPDGIPNCGAKELSSLAAWCFPELSRE